MHSTVLKKKMKKLNQNIIGEIITTKIYILTHKEFDYKNNELYEPLLNGSALLNEDYGYTRDDTENNISKDNPYYAELTGEYWAWKNSDANIIGFCHYRRYFVKNIFMEKIDEIDIEKSLKNNDIILPQKKHLLRTNLEEAHLGGIELNTCEKKEDYYLLRKIIQNKSPEYLKEYDEVLVSNEIYLFNMFICKKELADEYFNWLFTILNEFKKQNDFSAYEKGNTRVLGYLSERLLNVFVKKHDLKVKEYYILQTDARVPQLLIIENRIKILQKLFRLILNLEKKIKN